MLGHQAGLSSQNRGPSCAQGAPESWWLVEAVRAMASQGQAGQEWGEVTEQGPLCHVPLRDWPLMWTEGPAWSSWQEGFGCQWEGVTEKGRVVGMGVGVGRDGERRLPVSPCGGRKPPRGQLRAESPVSLSPRRWLRTLSLEGCIFTHLCFADNYFLWTRFIKLRHVNAVSICLRPSAP